VLGVVGGNYPQRKAAVVGVVVLLQRVLRLAHGAADDAAVGSVHHVAVVDVAQ